MTVSKAAMLRVVSVLLTCGLPACVKSTAKVVISSSEVAKVAERRESASVDTEDWRKVEPRPDRTRKISLPSVEQLALANGIPVYVVQRRSVPLVTVRILVRAGANVDPAGKSGLAHLVSDWLVEGTARRSALEVSEELERGGSTLSSGATAEYSFVLLETLRESLEGSLDVLAEVVLRPRFEQRDMERKRRETIGEIRQQADVGQIVARNVLRASIYGKSHPYAHSVLGTQESISKISRSDVARFHRRHWIAANAAILLVGDISAQEAKELLDGKFRSWKRALDRETVAVPPVGAVSDDIILVDRPAAAQVNLAIGYLGPSRASQDWPAVQVMGTALGGYFGSRITQNLRVAKGYTYNSASTELSSNTGPGLVSIVNAVGISQTAGAIREIVKEINRMCEDPPGESELELAKGRASDGFAARLRTNQQIAAALDDVIMFGNTADYLDREVAAVKSLSTEDVGMAARKYLGGGKMKMVVVGPAAKLEGELSALHLGRVRRWSTHLGDSAGSQ